MDTLSYLESRHCNTELYPGLEVDLEGRAWFPLYECTKQCGYFIINPNGSKEGKNQSWKTCKYTNLGTRAMFGMQQLDPNKKSIYVVEGVLDACRLHKLGYNALAVYSNTLSEEFKQQLDLLSYQYRLVAICDGDNAGRKLANHFNQSIHLPDGEDPNSVDESTLLEEMTMSEQSINVEQIMKEAQDANFEAAMRKVDLLGRLTNWRTFKSQSQEDRVKEVVDKGYTKIMSLMARIKK